MRNSRGLRPPAPNAPRSPSFRRPGSNNAVGYGSFTVEGATELDLPCFQPLRHA
ncbi:MAG TPA: hypothetical protein VMQ17_03180 [Candidatus Sulfotelmatobacter sp.]|nr:hypothetical protein [Candidatus Sulfotelmatobacter sp.]